MRSRIFALSILSITAFLQPITALAVDESIYEIDIDVETVTLDRGIKGYTDTGKITTDVNNFYQATFGVLIFPEDYRIRLGYTANLTSAYEDNVVNPAGFSSDTTATSFSAIPFYSETAGGISVHYMSGEAAGQFTNKTGGDLRFYDVVNLTGTTIIANNTTFKSKDIFKLTEISYLFPSFSKVAEGLNISYSSVTRKMVMLQTFHTGPIIGPMLVYNEGDASMLGFGYVQDIDELKQGLSLRKLKYSTGSLDSFSTIKTTEITAAVTYKLDGFYFDAQYTLFTSSTEGFTYDSGALGIWEGTFPELNDTMFYIKAGVSF